MVRVISVMLVAAGMSGVAAEEKVAVDVWWVDSLNKVLVDARPLQPSLPGEIHAARGEVEAIQLAVRCSRECRVTVKANPPAADVPIRVRSVGRVPIRRGTHRTPPEERIAEAPVRLPDPLFPEPAQTVAANQTECFWIDVNVPEQATPGTYETHVEVIWASGSRTMPLRVVVHKATVPFQGKLLLTNWFSVRTKELGYGDAEPGSDPWFACANLLFDSMWAHRQNMFWTPLGPPLIEPIVRDDGELGFDFRLFDAWVEAFSRPRGGRRKTYIEGQPIAWRRGYNGEVKGRVWQVEGGKPKQLIIDVSDPAAREGYRIFLTALRDHLDSKGWLDRFRIHITDEPHGHQLEPYAVVAGYIREFAPEFQIMEALDVRDDFAFFEKNCDVWVPQLGRFDKTLDLMLQRLADGKEVWIYTCLFPNGAYPNRFVDYALIKTRLLHWINFRWGFTGYLHWGFNHWRGGDPFQDLEPPHGESSFLPPGDAWIVYPGDRQLIDSVRYEAMRDGVEDYELLQVLNKKDPERAKSLAASVVRSFTDYVRDAPTFRQKRREMLEALD